KRVQRMNEELKDEPSLERLGGGLRDSAPARDWDRVTPDSRALYFFSSSSVASLRNIGRRRFAAFARSQGNDTSMRSASSSTSMRAAVWPSARMRKRNVSASQVSCSIAMIGPR